MKKLSLLISTLSLLASSSVMGTVVYTTTPNLGDAVVVMGIFRTMDGIQPCVATYSPGEISLPAVGYKSAKIACTIPSILLGVNTYKSFDGWMYYGGGEQVRPFSTETLGWLNSRWLGTVYVEHYPMVYSPEKGWVWVVEDETETDYWLYYFDTQSWVNRNLSAEFDPIIIDGSVTASSTIE